MNIEKLIWDNSIPFSDKLKQLTEKRFELSSQITNQKPIPFNIYYKFPEDLDEVKTANNKWKIVSLAIKVLKIVKRWYRKYEIDLKRKCETKFFIDYFKDTIDTSKFNLCTLGINFYQREKCTLKTFILWANKLCKMNVICDDFFNSFMEELERISKHE